MNRRETILAYSAFAIVCTIWGTTYLAIRIAIETLPTFLFAGARFTLAGLILLGIARIKGHGLPRKRDEWINLAIVGALMVGVGNIAVVWAERYVTSGMAALLVATSPFWMALLELTRREGEKLGMRRITGMAIGFSGVALLVAPKLDPSTFDRYFLAGVLVLQFGSICWNIGSMRSKYRPSEAHPFVSAALQMLSGGIIVTVIGFAKGEASEFYFTPRTLAAFLYLLIFGSVLAYGAYVYALSKLRTSTVSLYAYVNPAVAVVLGWLILSEPLGWRELISMAIILTGVAMVQSNWTPRLRKVAPLNDGESLDEQQADVA